MTNDQARALQKIGRAVIASCEQAAPGGVIYAALMGHGCTITQYEQIMSGLTGAGMLKKSGELYTATEKGRTFAGM